MLSTGSFRVKSGYLTAFLLLLMSYFLIFYTLQRLMNQSNQVEHTDRVINNLETLLSNMNQAESAARGYILLNDTDHLQTFYATTKDINALVENIDSLTADNTIQQKNVDTLKSRIQEKVGRMYKGILLFKEANYTLTAEMRGRGPTSKQLMNNIRASINNMQKRELSLLQERKDTLAGVSTAIKVITITSLVISLLLSIYSFVTFSREAKAKEKADEQSNLYRNELEHKVNELQVANKELIELRSIEKFAATGRIARTIAHEIRNPLTNISLAAEQIKASTNSNPETTTLLDMISRNAVRINQMISELLTSTKFAQLQYSSVQINDLINDTLELAKDRLELKQIAVVKNLTKIPCSVHVDADKMKIAFLNIIVNAIEAMDPGKGTLEITTEKVNDKCVIDIKDNGSGMNEETLIKLFEPYFTNKTKGAGLGLTNTQNIILNHKGNINVTSRLHEGTLFSIFLNAE